MADGNGPSSSVESRIEALKPDITPKDQKRLRLGMVVRVADRLDSLSLGCESCIGHLTAIEHLIDGIKDVESWQLPEWKTYYRQLDGMIKHLKTAHHLAEEGEHLAMWTSIGVATGAALGAVFGTVVFGLVLGVAFGVAVGGMLDAIAHKQGRVI